MDSECSRTFQDVDQAEIAQENKRDHVMMMVTMPVATTVMTLLLMLSTIRRTSVGTFTTSVVKVPFICREGARSYRLVVLGN